MVYAKALERAKQGERTTKCRCSTSTTVTVVDDRCSTSQQEWGGERLAEDNRQAEEILEAVGAVRALDTVQARLGG